MMAEDMSMSNFSETVGSVHKRLNEIGAPEDERGTAYRLYPVLDRLYLRAEGEPDCADSTALWDVRDVLAEAGYFIGAPAERTRALMQDRDGLRKKLNAVCADLEAERAQHAAKAKPVQDMTPREIAESFALLCLTDRENAGRLLPKFSGLYSMVEDL